MADGVLSSAKSDTLDCFLYPKFCFSTNPEQVTEELLVDEIRKYNHQIAIYTKDYIWHRDSLQFCPKTKRTLLLEGIFEGSGPGDGELLPHIHANIRFDEGVEDEWFTVFLIYNLTEVFDGLIARLEDSDGEFLLIEAANALPSWSTPETCQKRVFILNGRIHVIPDKHKSLVDLLNGIFGRPDVYKLAEEVQSIIRKRLNVYPNGIKEHMHKARAYLPVKAASMLQQEPGLIAPAIRTLFHSEPFERKVCRGMKYFPPEQRTMVNVKMTKCLYAMIMHSRYTGDPMTGWNLPPMNCSMYNSHLLGLKIACGFEMLVSKAHEEERNKKRDANILSNSEWLHMDDRTLNTYVSRLELNGYFKGFLEGSQEREKLLYLAKDYFSKHSSSDKNLHLSFENETEKASKSWKSVQINDVEMRDRDQPTLSPADSDSWLNVDPAQLDKLLDERLTYRSSDAEKHGFQSLEKKVQDFLNDTSDIGGVEFFGDGDTNTNTEDNGEIEFDTDLFDSALRDMLDFVVPGSEGEFNDSSDGSLGGDNDDDCGEIDKYMHLLDTEFQSKNVMGDEDISKGLEKVEPNLIKSLTMEEGGSGPTGNIVGGTVKKFLNLQLQSPSTVLPDLQS